MSTNFVALKIDFIGFCKMNQDNFFEFVVTLKARGISKKEEHERFILHDVSCSLRGGDVCAVIGPSG